MQHKQHRHNHGWTMFCVQLPQQTQNELQADISLSCVPTHEPNWPYWKCRTDRQHGEGLESSARVWNQVQTTGRSASTQTQRRPKKNVFLSQDFKQEWSHFGPRNPKLGSQRVSRKHAGKPREGSGNLGAGTSSICRRDQIQAAKPGQAGQRRNQK